MVRRCAKDWFLGAAATFVLLLGQTALAQPAAKTPLEVEDLFLFEAAQTVVHAPDGRWAVFARQWVDGRKQQRSSLWQIDAGKSRGRALEVGEPDARFPTLSPDGKWIAYLSTRPLPRDYVQNPPVPPESFPACDVWLIPTGGGAARPLAMPQKPYGRVFSDDFYAGLAFSADGRRLAFIAEGPQAAREKNAAREHSAADIGGEAYAGYRPGQLWVAELDFTQAAHVATGVSSLTNDEWWYGDPQWLPSGDALVVHVAKSRPQEPVRWNIRANFDLWQIDGQSGTARRLTSNEGPDVSPRVSPDGKRIVYLSSPRRGPHVDAFDLAMLELGSEPAQRTLVDLHAPKLIMPKDPIPIYPLPNKCWRGSDELAYRGALGAQTTEHVLRVSGTAGKAQPGDGDERRRQIDQQLSIVGMNGFFESRLIPENKLVAWRNKDQALEGILTLPPAGIGKPPYKLMVIPHGGPHSRSTTDFRFEVALFAAQGYAVFQPNYRGSVGYGVEFLDANRFDFGGVDVADILSGIELLVAQGTTDPKRQFIYGTSYGGFLACWLVGHTGKFQAAVAQNPVTDLSMMWSLSDIPTWVEWEFGGRPWEIADALRKHSPLTYAQKVQTPTLLLLGDSDRRCPPAMGYAFHRVLHSRGTPTALVSYTHEGHAIQQPAHRADVLRRVLDWFDRHDR